MTLCDPTDYPCRIAGEAIDFDPDKFISPRESRRMARFSQIAVSAALMAVEDSRLDVSKEDSFRVGVCLGNGNGGFPTLEESCRVLVERGGMRMSPFFFPMVLPNMAAANVSRFTGARGYNSTAVTACAASNQAMGEALQVLRRGDADVMLAGGAEAGISQLGLAGFAVMRALSTRNDAPEKASRPFDAERDGFVPAEGAVVLVAETLEHALKRGANILCEFAGFGSSSDAHHPVQPGGNGRERRTGHAVGAKRRRCCLGRGKLHQRPRHLHSAERCHRDDSHQEAVRPAGLPHPRELYQVDDWPLPRGSRSVGGSVLRYAPSLTGQFIPQRTTSTPIRNATSDYVPNVRREADVRVVLSNAFGFGGQNACLVFRKYEG